MNLDKLKEAARKYEQREEWRRAIDVYLQAIREAEEAGEEGTQDPGLYNRVGDLQLKAGDSLAALRAYEEAAELYVDQGFFNNAIALCGKILRVNPSRTATYLRLAQLHARKNFVGEARKNLVEYLERMNGVGQLDEAFGALKLFAEQFSANPEIRLMLVELLRASSRTEDAQEQLDRLLGELEARGDSSGARRTRERFQSLGPSRQAGGSHELVFLDTSAEAGEPAETEGTAAAGVAEPNPEVLGGPAVSDPSDPELVFDKSLSQAEELAGDRPEDAGAAALPDPTAEVPLLDLSDALATADFDPGIAPVAAVSPHERAALMIAMGDWAGGLRVLEEALRQYEAESRWPEALAVAAELIRLEPGVIYRYQKQVELAYFLGEREQLTEAYLQLGGALARAGAPHHAAQVYRRVLNHDPEHPAANAALALLNNGGNGAEPATESPSGSSEFVDLGALILGEGPRRDTRMRVDHKEEIEDEDLAFQEALADFKKGIEANLDVDDSQAHYDLGIAFKEMGLVDEAIAQFQKALRSSQGTGRLRTSEQLGIAFFDQGQFGIAEAVLRRALNTLPGDDDEKIGLLYWLGRALESQGKGRDALALYEQAVAVDIRFLDVRERVYRLAAEARA